MQGNNHDDVRRHNLATILRLVHRSGPLSRAALTRLTGLNRSTVSALVSELVQIGLAVEREPEASRQVGRPSPVVQVNPRVVAIAVHPEIDAVTVGLVGLDGVVHRRIRCPVERSPSATEAVNIAVAVIDGMRGELDARFDVVGVGVAVPGLVRTHDGLVRHAPHLGWVAEPFAERLSAATGYPVVAANDASLGVLAERYFGAGVGITDLVYLNGGASGIGGGLLMGGQLLGGHAGYAGEFGHAKVSEGAAVDSAGLAGTLEAEVTRSGLLAALGLSGTTDADDLERALLGSDSPQVRAEVNRQLDFLAVALAGAINILNPQLVVLGGFLAALRAVDPDRLQNTVAALTLAELCEGVGIGSARLGSNQLMIGAAELAFEGVFEDPQSFVRGGDA
ncbi:ROK family transcriptional regulator [Cryobacterium psychrophilum]|uniref:ROK family transcriptional regulator n=1 Tax=Cryobacterium psychrophilum TaxID=41988 RepID=A0A4Y8KMT4_9MICO|nr:ROK family transcriptional regulator [Cryobacterium psychrophilum]TDW30515.1 putative NBD/HSP70 family sugar kinase [Cryobacterium psychrophilum]TFD76313.1 ROK family transcriptional regulator [Cryobacterium psychrophilum]